MCNMKKTISVIILVLLTGLALSLILINENDTKRIKSSDTINTEKTAREIALETIKFVDSSLNEEEQTYKLIYRCSKKQQDCSVVQDSTSPPHMGYAIMSLRELGLLTENERLTQKADTLINEAIDKCEDDQRYCEWNFFPLHTYYKATGDQKYLDAMLQVSESVMRDRPTRELLDKNLPVKWWRLYDATEDSEYLKPLTALADEQLEQYPEQRLNDDLLYTNTDYEVRTYDLPIIWALYLPAYQASSDDKYLQPAIDFFKKADVSGNVYEFQGIQKTGDLVKGAESLIMLAEADQTNRDFYLSEAQTILEVLLKERWDTPENILINGDYGIMMSANEKATNIQGWITHLLFKLDDVIFNLGS